MLPRLALVLLLAGCAADSGIIPSNRYIDRDIEGTRAGAAPDVQNLRASDPAIRSSSRDQVFVRF
jgi:hypothetical protein